MDKKYDAIIIGAGVIGSAISFELSKKGYKTINIDRNPTSGYGSTAASCAIIRVHYSTLDGCALAYEGYHYWKDWEKYLEFKDERIEKFAVMDIDSSGYLKKIMEKPDPKIVEKYRDTTGEIRVSMNIFSFNGKQLNPYLKDCPIHPDRQEKELPEAIKLLNNNEPNQIMCFGMKEHILDLTSAEDIASFDSL